MFALNVKHILAPVDLGEASRYSLRYTRALAERFKCQVTVVYVSETFDVQDLEMNTARMRHELQPEEAHQVAERVRDFASTHLDPIPFKIAVAGDEPAEAIAHAARVHEADLIVIGTHARHGLERLVAGSVAEGVLRATDRRVITVPMKAAKDEKQPVGITRILCPINFSATSREAAVAACGMANAFGADLHLIHIAERGEPEGDLERKFREWLGPDETHCKYRDLVMRRGRAADRVLDYMDDIGADLLVIGARHRRHQQLRTVIGATAQELLRSSRYPVFTILHPVAAEVREEEEAEIFAGV